MQCYYREYGSDPFPCLIILHGLFGSSDNWHTFAKSFEKHFHVFTLDARNHGRSPHSPEFTYEAMADDILEFITQHNIKKTNLIGHSMGGKTAMLFSLLYPHFVDKLVVVDISPREYSSHHDHIFEGLSNLDLSTYSSQKQIDSILSMKIPQLSTRQFLLKNLTRDEKGNFQWKMNFDVIMRDYKNVLAAVSEKRQCDKSVLFIRGENSEYIQMTDLQMIGQLFSRSEFVTIKNAGHWVHADAPEEFVAVVREFLNI